MKWAFTSRLRMFDDILCYPEDVARIIRNYKISVVVRLVKWAEAERAYLFVDGIFGEAASPDDVKKLEDSYPFSSPLLIPLDDVSACSKVFEERRRRVKMDVSRDGENLRFRNEEIDITLDASDFSIYEAAGIARLAMFEKSKMERLELRVPSFKLEKVYVFEGCDVPHEASTFPGVSVQILEGYVSDPEKFIESYRSRTNAVVINKLKPFDPSRVSPAQLRMLETFKSNFEKVMLYESLEEILDED